MTAQYLVALIWRMSIMLFLQDSVAILGILALLVVQWANILRLLRQCQEQWTPRTWSCQNLSQFHRRPARWNTAGTIQVRITDSLLFGAMDNNACINEMMLLMHWREDCHLIKCWCPSHVASTCFIIHYSCISTEQCIANWENTTCMPSNQSGSHFAILRFFYGWYTKLQLNPLYFLYFFYYAHKTLISQTKFDMLILLYMISKIGRFWYIPGTSYWVLRYPIRYWHHNIGQYRDWYLRYHRYCWDIYAKKL